MKDSVLRPETTPPNNLTSLATGDVLRCMLTSRYVRGLVALGMTSLLGCGVTITELQTLNPRAATLRVHCHPWQVPADVKLLAAQSSADYTDHIVTDQTPGELLEYAPRANVFIEVDASAPRANARQMASEYGLVCQEDLAVRSTPLETLRPKEPCSVAGNASASGHLVGNANPPPCGSGAGDSANTGAGSAPAARKRIGVCARPPGITSDEWYGGPGITANVKTEAEYDAQVAKATVIFYLDPSAPPESIWHFGPDIKVRCPGKAPIPYDQWVAKNSGTAGQQSSNAKAGTGTSTTPNKSSTSTTPNKPTTSTAPNTGSSPPSSTSSPNGQGPALSVFETIVNNMAVGGALAQGNTSGSLNDPNGHRNGIPGGKNVGGFSFPLLQMGVATFQIISAVGLKPKDFINLVHLASKKGQRTVIEKADKAALDLADDLVKNHGQYPMAKGLEEMQTIMPYSMAEKFTKDLGNAFQAHKIFERRALDKLKQSDAGFEKLPAVILTKEEHQEVTNLLNAAWNKLGPKKGQQATVEELRAIYKAAYANKYPHWLEIIEKQLRSF